MFGEFEKRFLSSLIAGGTALVLAPSALGTNLIQNSQFTTTNYISGAAAPATSSGGQLANPGTYAANNSGNIYASSWTVSGINNTGESYLFVGNPNGVTLNQAAGGGATFSLYNSTVPITAAPGGGNVIALDGGVGFASILSQTISGLMAGSTYSLTFEYAGAEQNGYASANTAGFAVNLGTANAYGASISTTYTGGSGNLVTAYTNGLTFTPTLTITDDSIAHGEFTGWFTNTMYFTATNSSEVLSFLADGTPSGDPPFSLLADVSLTLVPEPSTIFATTLLLIPIGASVVRRWRNRATAPE